MRLYPNSRFYSNNPTSDVMTAPVIIVGPANYESAAYVARLCEADLPAHLVAGSRLL